MSTAQKAEGNQESGTVSPEEPSIEDESDVGLGGYDTNIVQLSDTEEKGIAYDEIVEQYDEGDVDAFIYAGDASKKMMDPASYLGQFEETYQDLSNLKEELGAEVLVEPGNHAPIKGAHNAGGWAGAADDTEYVEQVEDILGAHYEEFGEFEGNAFEFLAEEYDLTNIEYDSVDIGDITVVGGTHSDAELDKLVEKSWFDEGPEMEDLGYESDDLENIASELSGGFFSRILNTVSFGYLGSPKKEAEDVSLDDITDEVKTEEHEAYEELLDLQNYFEDAIESAENDVFLTHHSVPSGYSDDFGSKVVDQVMEDYSEELVGVGGGHTGTAGIEEHYGVPTVNTNNGAVIELGFDDGTLEHQGPVVEAAEPESEGPSREDLAKTVQEIEEVGGPDAYYEEVMEPRLQQAGQNPEIDEDRLEQIKRQQKEQLEALWENKDQILGPQKEEEGPEVEA